MPPASTAEPVVDAQTSRMNTPREAPRRAPCLLLFMLVSLIADSGAGFSVMQPPASIVVMRGHTGRLECTFSPGSTAKGAVSWHRIPTNGNSSFRQPVELKQRLSLVFPDSFLQQGDASLLITNASLEDEGIYFCHVMLWESTTWGQGNGTPLLVYAPPSQPALSLLQATRPGEKTALLCKTEGFYPSEAQLTWSIRGVPLADPVPAPQYCVAEDGLGKLTSSLTLPEVLTNGGITTFTCIVTHPSLQHPLLTNYTYCEYIATAIQEQRQS
ncbi:tapasin-related protein-like [Ambystoma mexicanum]|uniref:tapasin-related protein-like n=1 Tax=Ambystoma mexicanum TaxID=8296 RepID=UPI0037E7B838